MNLQRFPKRTAPLDQRDERDLAILFAHETLGWDVRRLAEAFCLPAQIIETILEEDGR